MMQQITPGTIESESQWGDGNAAGTVECESHWGTATLTGSSTFPACFELELTTDLPNGPCTFPRRLCPCSLLLLFAPLTRCR